MSLQIEFYNSSPDQHKFMTEFIEFPNTLFAQNPKIKKLPFQLEAMYFKIHHLDHDFLIIKNDGVIVLRSMLCLTTLPDLAYFGLIDFDFSHPQIETILSEFKKTLNSWCLHAGASKIYGPINFSTWLPYRLMSSNDGGPLFSFEPDRPIEYCQLLKSAGFMTNQVFSSKGLGEITTTINSYQDDYEKSVNAGFKYEFFPRNLGISDVRDLHRLSLSIFSGNYLATPIDFEIFSSLYAAQANKDDYSFSVFILSKSGERIGFFINFLEHDYSVAKTIGVDKIFRGQGLSNGAMYLSLKKAHEAGIKQMVTAMVKEGAQSESYGKLTRPLWTHLYEILELKIVEN